MCFIERCKTMSKRKRCTAKIIIAPNPILQTVCKPVEANEDVSGIIRDMMFVLTNSKHGVGLAANQVGYDKRIILFSANGFPKVLINPVFIPTTSMYVTKTEGCLSYPKTFKDIERCCAINVEYITHTGESVSYDYEGFSARIIQHETDHLNGQCKVGE